MLQEQIRTDMIVAMKARQTDELGYLRGLLSDLKNKEIDKKSPLTDEEVIAVIKKMVKNLTEAKDMFLSGGRDDLAAENDKEIAVLGKYLPAEMSDTDLEKKVEEVLKDFVGETNRGKLIGAVVGKLKGQADGGRIAVMVNRLLNG